MGWCDPLKANTPPHGRRMVRPVISQAIAICYVPHGTMLAIGGGGDGCRVVWFAGNAHVLHVSNECPRAIYPTNPQRRSHGSSNFFQSLSSCRRRAPSWQQDGLSHLVPAVMFTLGTQRGVTPTPHQSHRFTDLTT